MCLLRGTDCTSSQIQRYTRHSLDLLDAVCYTKSDQLLYSLIHCSKLPATKVDTISFSMWLSILEKLPVSSLLKDFPFFVEPERSAIGFHPQPDCPVHTFEKYIAKLHFNIILPSSHPVLGPNWHTFLYPFMCTTCHANLTLLDMINLMLFADAVHREVPTH